MILKLSLELPEDKPYVTLTRLLGRTTLQYLHVAPITITDIETVLDELTSNVIRHARSEEGRFSLTLEYYAERIVVRVQDKGVGFDPAAVLPPGTPRPDLDGGERLGGFGLGLLRALTDRLEFHSAGDKGTTVEAEVGLTYQTPADRERAAELNDDNAVAVVTPAPDSA